jgi:putative ubiquitin-RnfH superfamily antitoxin RatB of RatAB toxin-antitoxin module
MNALNTEERIELLKNLLSDPDDWISREIIRLSDEEEEKITQPVGIRESAPEMNK